MAPQSHPRPSHPPFAFLLLLALLLPLLAACGGAPAGSPAQAPAGAGLAGDADTSAPIGGPAQPTAAAAAMPTTAPAAQATAAPAATMMPEKPEAAVAELPHTAGEPADAAPVSMAPTAPPAPAGGAAPPSTSPPERINNDNQQGPPLKAGEVDDNADFAAYMEYLRSYSGPPAHDADISERYILTVLNDRQQPVLDAHVRLFDGQSQVFEGRTYAGGKTIVFPRALGISGNSSTLRVEVEKGNSTVEGELQRGQDETFTFVLEGAQALPQQPRLDVLFLLDATGSMDDEITRIQQTLLSIAERIDRIEPRPALRFGLVAYRDYGDEYVTRTYDFTADVATFRELLMSVRADGGGDTPEALNEALHEAVQGVNWADDAVRLTFLVADAPPHTHAREPYDYVEELREAVARGVKIYPIAASNSDEQAEYVFRQLAQQTLGHFIFLTYQQGQNAGTPGDTTVHDVDPDAFTVERLDDLVVQVVERELAQAQGRG
jgi:hypothetical protein